MALLELFDKWIVERGSAKVQEKHIALFRDQLADAEAKIAVLESGNIDLTTKLLESEKEIKILRRKLQEYEKKPHDLTIEETEVKILTFLSSTESSPVKEISNSLNFGETVAAFHLEELKRKGMVKSNHVPTLGDYWSLEQPGRKYLIQNNLIK